MPQSPNPPFHVGLTRDFLDDDGRLVFKDIALDLLDAEPGVTYAFFDEHREVVTPDQIADFDAVISYLPQWTQASFEGADRLTLLARFGVGYDMVDITACTESGIIVAITPEGVRRPMAEGALTLILALAKEIFPKNRVLREGRWMDHKLIYGSCLMGKTVGSVGLGNIGADLMRLVEPFKPGRCLAYDPYCKAEQAEAVDTELVDLDTLLTNSDFVCINCMLTEQTRGLIGPRELGLMKETAYLVNTSRGPVINQKALADALVAQQIRGAALDVFEQEPIDMNDPLLALNNVILLPHAIGYTHEALRGNGQGACEAALAVQRGEPPTHVVNRDVLKRSNLLRKLARFKM